jgi:hypothetical protein
MNLYYFLLFFAFLISKTGLIEAIEKKIKEINRIEEKIITIEAFLEHALDQEPIKKLLYFLETNKLLNRAVSQTKQFSFHDLLLLINENSLIEYIKKNNISKNTIENILKEAFEKTEERGITFFVKTLFITIKTKQEQEITTKIEKEAQEIIADSEEREKKTKELMKENIEKQEKLLKDRMEAREITASKNGSKKKRKINWSP